MTNSYMWKQVTLDVYNNPPEDKFINNKFSFVPLGFVEILVSNIDLGSLQEMMEIIK